MLLLCRSSSVPQLWLAGNNWGDSGVSRSRIFFPFLSFPSPCSNISFTRLCSVLRLNHPHPSWPHGHERSFCVSMHTPLLFFYFFYSFIEQTVPVLSIILGRFSPFVPPPNFISLCLLFRSLSPPFIAKPCWQWCWPTAELRIKHILHCIFLPRGFSWHMASLYKGWAFEKFVFITTLRMIALKEHTTQDPTTTHPRMSEKTPKTHGGLYSFVPLFTGTTLNFGQYMSASCTPSIRDAVKESHLLWPTRTSGCCSATTVLPVFAFVAMFLSAIFSLHSFCLWLLLKSISISSSQFQNSRSEID